MDTVLMHLTLFVLVCVRVFAKDKSLCIDCFTEDPVYCPIQKTDFCRTSRHLDSFNGNMITVLSGCSLYCTLKPLPAKVTNGL